MKFEKAKRVKFILEFLDEFLDQDDEVRFSIRKVTSIDLQSISFQAYEVYERN